MNPTSGARILIVDDDPAVRDYLADLVRGLGAAALEAPDGQAGVALAQAESPDLILLDGEMPRMDGFTACRLLKSNPVTARTPIVMITALSALQDRVRGIEAGTDDFLEKPIRVPEFNARVRSLLRVKKLNESLESAENVVFALAGAIEARDKYTGGHTERVTAYAVALGQAAGCSEDELTGLRQGGTLHDIGKVAVPDHILNKNGKLTAEEFQIMRQHPLTGYNICLPMKSLARTLPCIRWHHEKPNGQGYPDGLKGAAIPRMALILAVADVYDALTSARSYKAAFSRAKAIELLTQDANTGNLDPDLIKLFVETVLPTLPQ